jgi:pimeloyl-ACP methyl ester carboxylesterase
MQPGFRAFAALTLEGTGAMNQAHAENARLVDFGPVARADICLADFEHRFETVHGIRMHFVQGGNPNGCVVVLLAGFPQSWFAWRKVMPILGETFRVIAVDLPGQGDSDRPLDGYDTKTSAYYVKELLERQGIGQAFVAGHDVGAWVAFPLAAGASEMVQRVALLDAGIPGVTLPDALPIASDRALRTWHFAFHSIPDLPETLITGRERQYVEWHLRRKSANPDSFTEEDLDEYTRVLVKDGGLRATLNFYRSVGVSAQQNRKLCEEGKLQMPLLAVNADQGSIVDMAGPLRQFADDVTGITIGHCGHFIPEEQPSALAQELLKFFK